MDKVLFQIVFTDGSTFEGGDYQDTKWLQIPKDKKIRTLFYLLPTGDYIGLGGFKRIYQYVEVVEDINGPEKGKKKIEFICLIIERDNKYIQYKINQVDIGIEINTLTKESEYVKKLNPIGWR
jgi:hypothetical protein